VSGSVTYCATKWGVVGLSHALDDELRGSPVAVTVVLPGIVKTELSAGLPRTVMSPEVQPADIADAVVAACARPQREVWVPRSGRVTFTIARALPAGVRSQLTRLFGAGTDPLLQADPAARRAYEERIAAAREQEPV
jgi:short-subunit dehydrogenase